MAKTHAELRAEVDALCRTAREEWEEASAVDMSSGEPVPVFHGMGWNRVTARAKMREANIEMLECEMELLAA